MELILDGNSEIDAHIRSNLCYLICLRHLIRSHNLDFSTNEPIFLHAAQHFLSYHGKTDHLEARKRTFIGALMYAYKGPC